MKMNVDQDHNWTNDDLLSQRDRYNTNVQRDRYTVNGKLISKKSFADFTLKASIMALISTLLIIWIFEAIGEQTASPISQISEMIVLGLWFLPDIISIPFVGLAAAAGVVVEFLKMQMVHAMRHALALGICIFNAYLVIHHLLDRFAFFVGN